MKILSITAQKVDSTGSGVFLTELTKGFRKLGCAQAVVCGTVEGDTIALHGDIALYPVVYKTPELPFPICGMSDEMPYESTRYCDLDEEKTQQLLSAFRGKVTEAVESFQPDVILCHHLYFLAAPTCGKSERIPGCAAGLKKTSAVWTAFSPSTPSRRKPFWRPSASPRRRCPSWAPATTAMYSS